MGLIEKILTSLKNLVSKETSEIDGFLAGYNHISQAQMQHILDIINTEIKKSEEFGLIIRPEDVLFEKHAIMAVVNIYGGVLSIKKYHEVNGEITTTTVLNDIAHALKWHIDYYYKNSSEGEVRNKYNCHIHCVGASILQDIYNDNFPT